ncbi:mandelate racemase/muconate lactonizing enzyme family protein [Amylibacter sp. IMCC11727]|uniref:mandelate racemase/muconate lactonizing enzyme family protein n=1 Tax=Amylibacter sp. IMCC11727 TaxID=3039851 RepID=UPI00244DAAE2|nr:mandelate racemase/muconate lactonizing enzyme family protein [Amylibacter sp. IMCC11727]WGI21830.1 mandelate racemase/muconate lactonizing enzyme family protein [Amylibacter sp. IMCC11727]
MRIQNIQLFTKALPIVGGPYTMSRVTLNEITTTIVRIESDTGLVGWGEVAPLGPTYQPAHALGAVAAIKEMAPHLIGAPAHQPLTVMRLMNGLLEGHNYAKAAIDIALWDLTGKHYGARVCDLLGGAEQNRLPAYYAVGIGAPDEVAKIVSDKIDMGYKRIQIKVGGRNVATDIDVVRAAWDVCKGRASLVADPNRGMLAAQAKALSLACADIPFSFEQPCNTMDEIASIRSQIVHPIIVDESTESLHDVLRAIEMGICDGFGFKVTRLGGLTNMMAVRDVAASRAMPHTVEDSWGGDIVSAAILHLAATVEPRLLDCVWTAGNYIEEHYDPENGIKMKDGYFDVPTGVGLGINPSEDRIGRMVASFD